jgi:hypothetical protein
MKPATRKDQSEEYQRFEALTQALVAVPKTEIDAAAKKDKQKKARAKKARRPATASR